MTRARLATLLLAVGALGLAGCSSGSGPSPSTPPASTIVETVTPTPTATATAPISTGPTTSARAASCPFAGQAFVRDTMGMRLGRVLVLRSGGKVVGCRIYALQGGALHKSEHLPGPNQPAVEIITQRFADATAAHNAFVRRATAGTNPQQVDLGGVTGVCFQNAFDPQDKGKDWACAVNKGAVEVVVRTVDITGTFSTVSVTKTVLRAV